MNQKQIKLAKWLTIFGAIPFIACVVLAVATSDKVHAGYFSLTYGAVIASFLSGMHWGLYLTQADKTRINLLITSNMIALLSWLSLLLIHPLAQYCIQIACFMSLLIIDRVLMADGIISQWFYRLRVNISIVVVISLIVLAFI